MRLCEHLAQCLVPEGLFSAVDWSLLHGPVLVSGLDFLPLNFSLSIFQPQKTDFYSPSESQSQNKKHTSNKSFPRGLCRTLPCGFLCPGQLFLCRFKTLQVKCHEAVGVDTRPLPSGHTCQLSPPVPCCCVLFHCLHLLSSSP